MVKNTSQNLKGWMGWIGFAAIMLMLGGFFHLLAGFMALYYHGIYFVAAPNSVWIINNSQWGWLHIIGGLFAIGAAASLIQGHLYGRVFAIIVAMLSAVISMAFIPIYPIWSIMIIIVDVFVIWAVATHAGELEEM
jgi:hypothetical protein